MSNVWLDLVGHLFACSGLIMVSDVGTKITANAAGKEARHSCNLKLKTSLPQSSNDSTLNEGTFFYSTVHLPSAAAAAESKLGFFFLFPMSPI